MHKFNTSFLFHFYIIGLTSWILNPALQLKDLNLRALQNETRMRTSILNIVQELLLDEMETKIARGSEQLFDLG